MSGTALACPACHSLLEPSASDRLTCPADRRSYSREDGIWHCLLPEREAYFSRFLKEYEAVRMAEGRGSRDPAYYRALPYVDSCDPFYADWRLRARSYTALLRHVLEPLERGGVAPLNILDLGAGNGWLSYRLAQRGHQLTALDLRTGDLDGLGAIKNYDCPITCVQAEFDYLPFSHGEIDLAIFNASLHYSPDYAITLREALRVLAPGGQLVIVDTPVYRQASSGHAMVRERQEQYLRKYGFPSDAILSEEFLTPARLGQLSSALAIGWRAFQPPVGLSWRLRFWRARLRGRREPANFPLIVGKRLNVSDNRSRIL